jgi:hypothetical protein
MDAVFIAILAFYALYLAHVKAMSSQQVIVDA